MTNSFMIYGAAGYSGRLAAENAAAYGLKPLLAGREEHAIKELAGKLGLSYRVFSLDQPEEIVRALEGVELVLNTAGPFDLTVEPFVTACLKTKTHYMDLNGEQVGFEKVYRHEQQARERGIMLLPAAGFDVVPSDCLALFLKKQLPDATLLRLGFATLPKARMSRGTALTALSQLGWPGLTRQNGQLVAEPIAAKGRIIDYGTEKIFSVSVPWGDLFTAYQTTQIANIETYFAASRLTYYVMKFQILFNWLLKWEWIKWPFRQLILQRPPGPDLAQRTASRSVVWGQVINASGQEKQALLHCPEVYDVTYHSTLLIARRILAGQFFPGVHTPAGAFGEDLVLSVPGTRREILKSS